MKKAVFLDRDGTLNPDPGYISDPENFNLFPGVPEALSRLRKAGFLLILITNQSGIARGMITFEQLESIHEKMQKQLAVAGAEVDAIYFCPHHPDFPDENGIGKCVCRKPETGLIDQACQDFPIDKKRSYMVGDKSSDVNLGLNAGLNPIQISTLSKKPHGKGIPVFDCLDQVVDYILESEAK